MATSLRKRFGVHALFVVLTVVVVSTVILVRSHFTYEAMAHRDFGSPARIAAVVECFERIEKAPPSDFVAVVDDPREFGFPETRVIPPSEIPKELAEGRWRTTPRSSDPELANFFSVLAHYDEHHQLRAIEFYGSRYGGFVSRDPALKPKMPGELQQLAGAPVFITARITGGD